MEPAERAAELRAACASLVVISVMVAATATSTASAATVALGLRRIRFHPAALARTARWPHPASTTASPAPVRGASEDRSGVTGTAAAAGAGAGGASPAATVPAATMRSGSVRPAPEVVTLTGRIACTP